MYKRLICLTALVLLLALASHASGALVAWWPFNNSPNDQVGALNWTLTGGATYSADCKEGSYSLLCDGVDDRATLAGSGLMSAVFSTKTVALWFKANSTTGTQVIYDEGGGSNGWCIRLENGALEAAVCASSVLATLSTPFSSPKWSHVAMSFDNGVFKLYLNGKEVASTTASFTSVPSHTNASGLGATNAGNAFVGATTGDNFGGLIDDVRMYDTALTKKEITKDVIGVLPGQVSEPIPTDKATDVPRDVVLSWTPGEFAAAHDVYFGTVFDDVNNASRANQRGVLASQGQIATTYDPPGRLDLGQIYYWRIDEVNAPPTSTIFKGDVWSFTVEPFSYPIDVNDITATASSSNSAGEGPQNTINGSGLDADDLHSLDGTDMWLSSMTGAQPTWIQYEFDKVYKLYQMVVWNYNTSVEPAIGFGIKEAVIEYSTDGVAWTTLGTTHEFARGPGSVGYAASTTVEMAGAAAKYVKVTPNSNWGGILAQYGLSEIRFSYIPVIAREPDPASDATNTGADATLSWRAGREAAKHNVYLDTDEQAVTDGTAPVVTVTSPSYSTSLDLARTYYWRVDEVNEAETPSAWQGDIWSFSTQEYLVVDDFEAYNDIEAGQEGSNLVYETWADGFANPSVNGSTMGYTMPFEPSLETSIAYDGEQSAPLFYDNTAASYSEITTNTADLPVARDWTKHGISALSLMFLGDPTNTAQQMYVKINGSKVTYDGDAENLKRPAWQRWYIDLAPLGVNLSNVTTLTIGFERIGAVGGQGMILLDAIRLYRVAPAPVETVSLTEDFDSLAVGSNMHDVDGWEGWFGDAQLAARVTDAVAHSGTNALEIVGTRDDLVPHWPLVDSGIYVASIMQYVPASTTAGIMHFGPLRSYGSSWGDTAWMADLRTDCSTGLVYVNELDASTRTEAPLIRDQWVQLRLVMNFDINACDFYYGDVLLGTYECPSVQGFDIYPTNEVDVVYFDDFRFEAVD